VRVWLTTTLPLAEFEVTVLAPERAVAVAVFEIAPASRSAWVTTWVPVQVVEAPLASGLVAPLQLTASTRLSVTA
jgi:hypothetical protein